MIAFACAASLALTAAVASAQDIVFVTANHTNVYGSLGFPTPVPYKHLRLPNNYSM